MATPYSVKPNTSFWRRSVAGLEPEQVDPVTDPPFRINRTDAVATAGSCFAQHIASALKNNGFRYLVTEEKPLSSAAIDQNYGIYPARFGNIYTTRQLLQTLDRAYGLFSPIDSDWERTDGRFVDPFRPLVQDLGFVDAGAVSHDREMHLRAVRRMFEDCSVFIFTFGLTEAWESSRDGAVFPLVPQAIAAGLNDADYRFRNFTVAEMSADLTTFIKRFRQINPKVKIILTVSPVSLIATFENRHVLVSNTFSKAALRVVADEISKAFENIAYFPSYEIVTGPQTRWAYLEDDLREIRPEGVAHVMSVFARHYLNSADEAEDVQESGEVQTPEMMTSILDPDLSEGELMRERQKIICDESVIEPFL